jgi:hypothetical protein
MVQVVGHHALGRTAIPRFQCIDQAHVLGGGVDQHTLSGQLLEAIEPALIAEATDHLHQSGIAGFRKQGQVQLTVCLDIAHDIPAAGRIAHGVGE